MAAIAQGFMDHFNKLQDPRTNNHNLRHHFSDILIYTLLAVICGADGWVEVEQFGKAKLPWLSTFLELPNGIASHDVIGDLFSRIDPVVFNQCFVSWIQAISVKSAGRIIAVDGKTLRGSYQPGDKKTAIHVVNAWCDANGITLGQFKTAAKSNEITAIPELLDAIDIKGSVVTIDAMGCQKKIANKILEKEGDYLLAVKSNQPKLHSDIQTIFSDRESNPNLFNYNETYEENYGRIEHRRFWTTTAIDSISNKEEWPGLYSIGMVESNVFKDDTWHTDVRYYISSTNGDVSDFANQTRKHWGVENKLHWMLDVNFNEDKCRIREGNAPSNMSLIRKIALTLLNKDKSSNVGIGVKRKKAGWNNKYLEKILSMVHCV